MTNFAKYFILLGILFLIIGGVLYLFGRAGIANIRIPFGRLPGDIRIEGEHFTCLVPIVSSILLSIILTIVLNILVRMLNR